MFHDDDMTQLTAIDPAHDLGDKVHPDSPEARAIFARITAELGDPAPAGRSKRTTPVRMAITMAGAVAVISASALILAPDPERPLGPSEASAALHQLAIAAAAHKDSDPPLQAGKYYYERTVGNGLREEWISRDGMLFASGAEFDGIQRMGNIGGRPGVYATFGDSSLTYDQVLDLPRDPGRLYGYMAAHVSVDQDDPTALSQAQAIFFTLREFLIANPLPADLRAAFYEAAARIPGIEFLGRVPNEEGTVGLGVGMWRSGGPDVGAA